jgi:LacI family transcriptional regulator
MSKNAKNVVMFLLDVGVLEPQMLASVQAVAKSMRWGFSVVWCSRRKDGALKFLRSPGVESVAKLLKGLKPDGVIVALNAVRPDELRGHGRRAIPTVFIDRPENLSGGVRDPVCVFGDAASYARLAAEELLRSGFKDYAFLPFPGNPPWSRERCECFKRFIDEAGKTFHPFQPPRVDVATDLVAHLAPFLDSLPRPCGLFAANDGLGDAALRVCRMRGWAVPQDMAVIGVDNFDFICEMSEPTLSSIPPDWEGAARAAARLLAECMARPKARHASLAIPAPRVVRRASSLFAADRRIARAMEHIRLHACEAGFAPPDVVAVAGLSRSQTDLLFRRVIGRSILDAIHDARLARAQDLLRAGKPASFVADMCGYASLVDFRHVFKRRVGKTVRQWTLAARR